MTVRDLSRDQLDELKQAYVAEMTGNPSYMELADASNIMMVFISCRTTSGALSPLEDEEMKNVNGYFMNWDEAGDAIKKVLNDSTVDLLYEDDVYWAYSMGKEKCYDAGEVDTMLAKAVNFPPTDRPNRYVGFSCCFGVVIIDFEEYSENLVKQ